MNRKHNFNFKYFSKINTKDKAYWLGFIYADGCNRIESNCISILLSVVDIEHLKKFCYSLKFNKGNVKVYPPTKDAKIEGRKIINAQPSCRMHLNSKIMSKDLFKLGVFPNKSLILDFPDIKKVPNDLMSHFIRGVFDGDGCITKSINKNITRYRILIASSPLFCKKLSDYLNINLGINSKIWSCKKQKIKIVCISGNRQVKIFCDWMYKDSKIYLERKYLIYKEFNKKIRKINKKWTNTYSKFLNITFDKSREKWISMARVLGKTINLGRFKTEKEALEVQQKYYKENNNFQFSKLSKKIFIK